MVTLKRTEQEYLLSFVTLYGGASWTYLVDRSLAYLVIGCLGILRMREMDMSLLASSTQRTFSVDGCEILQQLKTVAYPIIYRVDRSHPR